MAIPLAPVCVSAESLRDWLEDRLDEGEAARVGAHLERCVPCRELLETLTQDADLQSLVRGCGPLPNGADGSAGLGALVETLRGLSRRTTPPPPAALTFLAPPLLDGDLGTMGTYRVLELIGQGGMGVVLKAVDTRLQRTVALKVIRPELVDDPHHLHRFQREGQALAGVKHPNIVEVHTVEQPADGPPYLVMEYVPGPTLAERLREQTRLDPRHAADIIAQVSNGLAAAHQAGLTHRDIKPGNIILEEGTGQAKLVDFGLVQLGQASTRLTRTGTVAGTLEYMSPEQVEPTGQVGPASDVYGLGVTLYEALTGEVPFRGTTAIVLRQILNDDPVPPQRRNEQVPRDLETICLKCLEKEAGRRYASVTELAADLRRLLQGEPIKARPVSAGERGWRLVKRRPGLSSLTAALVLVTVGGLAGILWYERKAAIAELESENNIRLAVADKAASIDQRYYARVFEVRNSLLDRGTGWMSSALTKLKEAVDLSTPVRDVMYLRNLVGECLAGVDLHEVGEVGQGISTDCLAVSPDGKFLALGDSHRALGANVYLFDRESTKLLSTFPFSDGLTTKENGVTALSFSPVGRWLVAGTRKGRLYGWNLMNSKLKFQHNAHQQDIAGLAFHPHKNILISYGKDKMVRVWNTETFEPIGTPLLTDKGFIPAGVLYSPTGDLLACWENGFLRFFDTPALEASSPSLQPRGSIRTNHGGICFNPDGRSLADVAVHSGITIFPVASLLNKEDQFYHVYAMGNLHRLLPEASTSDAQQPHPLGITSLAYNANGTLLISGGRESRLKVWDLASSRCLLTCRLGSERHYTQTTFTADGRWLIATAPRRTVIFALDADQVCSAIAPGLLTVTNFCFWRHRPTLICSSEEQHFAGGVPLTELSQWNADSGRLERVTPVGGRPSSGQPLLAAHPRENTFVSYCDANSDDICVFDDAFQRQSSVPRPHSGQPTSLCFSPDGNKLWGTIAATDKQSSCLFVLRWPSLKQLAPPWANEEGKRQTGRHRMVCLSAGNQWAVAGSGDGTTRIFSSEDITVRGSAGKLGSSPVRSVGLSGDETLAITGTEAGTVLVSRVPNGEAITELRAYQKSQAHEGSVEAIALGMVDKVEYLATGSMDSRVRLWSRQGDAFREVITLAHTGPIRQLEFTPDGKKLAVLVDKERAVRLWHLDRLRERLREMNLDW